LRGSPPVQSFIAMNSVLRGALAGGGGTAALVFSDAISKWRLGHRPVFAPSRVAHRFVRARLGRWLGPRQSRHVGAWMRTVYGPALGAALVPATARVRPWPLRAVAIGAAVLLFEAVSLPAAGATPRLSRWSRAEWRLWGVHVAWYGLVTAALARYLGALRGARA
jgi:hypothetical protein